MVGFSREGFSKLPYVVGFCLDEVSESFFG